MEIALIVGVSILLLFTIAASSLIYSHFIYSKNRLFSKTKYSILWIIVCSLVIVITAIAGSLFVLSSSTPDPIAYSDVCSGISFVCCGLTTIYLVFLCLIPTITNKNKIKYDDILKTNFQPMIQALMKKIGNLDQLKSEISKHSKNYYSTMLSYYESILKRVKDSKIPLVDKLADIITFNDAFTHKWSTKTNNLQLLLTYQFCGVLQKIS